MTATQASSSSSLSSFHLQLCDSEFIDLNVTWNAQQPRFSPCFRDTVLIWIPACVFILTLTSEWSNIRSSKLGSIPWRFFNRFRVLVTILLFVLKLIEFSSYLYTVFGQDLVSAVSADSSQANRRHQVDISNSNSSRGPAAILQNLDPFNQQLSLIEEELQLFSNTDILSDDHQPLSLLKLDNKTLVVSAFLAPLVELLSYLLLLLVYLSQRTAGLHTSATVWFYLFASLLCQSVEFYSVIFALHDKAVANHVELLAKLIHYPVLVVLFLLECYGDTPLLEPRLGESASDRRPDSPELTASYFSSITFWWFNGFLRFGYRCRLKLSNLWKTLPRDKASEVVPMFRKMWTSSHGRPLPSPSADKRPTRGATTTSKETYHLANGQRSPANSMISVLWKLFWAKLLYAASLKLIQDSLQFVSPMVLKLLLAFMRLETEPSWHGTLYALLLLAIPTLQSIILGNYFYKMQLIGLQVRTMIIGSIYRKSLLLSGSSRLQSTSGEIVNLMAVDSQRFQDLLMYANLFWSAPFQIVLAISLLYRELGWSVFAGVICMALVMPLNAFLANRIKFSQIKVMRTKDERVKQINEILSGIKVIKLYAWENSFIANIFGFRNKELNYLTKILTLDAMQTFLWQCCPFVVACVTFAVYINVDSANILNAEKAFVSISLFNLLRFPMTMLPSLVTSMVLTMVSAKRLNRFLNSNELVRYVTRNEELEAISIEGGTLSWSAPAANNGSGTTDGAAMRNGKHEHAEHDGTKPPSAPVAVAAAAEDSPSISATLKDIDFHVKPGTFVAIVGQVASGKSSLLAAILGEMHRLAGRFNVCKSLSMAYVPQQAWIQNMTLRDNILFGTALDQQRYEQILQACSLQSDLAQLPGGDQSEIGEKGINLSGGQKQRVSLARACYSDSDIYLLDDPLSALDSHVAKHVFDKVLSSSPGSLLRHKTRVLATNSLFVLPHVDQVVVLDQGRVVESGTYKELTEDKQSGYLKEIMRQYAITQTASLSSTSTMTGQRQASEGSSAGAGAAAAAVDAPPSQGSTKDVVLKNTTKPPRSQTALVIDEAKLQTEMGKLIDIEKVEMGSVNYRVYLHYFKAVSLFWLAFVVVSLFASSAFNVSTNLWLSIWSSDAEDPVRSKDLDLRTLRLLVYATFGGLQCFAVLAGSLALSRGAVRAARRLHSRLLDGVMHSPMIFFDTTPIGRVVNRFAKDIDVIDTTLPGTFRSWFNCLLQVVSTMFVICYSFPTFFIIIVPLTIIYWLIQKIFIVTTRQLKRLESTTRSPIYSNFSETLSGISTIRAYDCVDRFVRYSDNLVDRNQSCSYPNIIANRWLSVRLEFFGNLITSSAALFSVYYRGSIGAGVAGLTISYSLSITQTLSWLVRMTSDLETNIVSVERILEYIGNRQEDQWIKAERRPPSDWPRLGAIEFRNYSTKYREDTEQVLKNVSLTIRPSEKIGIVGRTGSGKSSLSLALFRILEPASPGAQIQIDGQDLSQFGLHDIRSKLTIIPQDPVLFSGTLRFNLDPLRLYSDADIWRSLELAHLKAYIGSLPEGLDYKVIEYGENFSVGQRQLICLARAILRKSKVLILDEATASVDLETDSIVQKTIREIFADCTIITIAHRLHTILDSDRILVLDSGQVKELDSPQRLLERPESSFAALIRDAGLDTNAIVRQRMKGLPPTID